MYPNLRAEAARAGMTYKAISKMLGIAEKTVYLKINGHSEFTLSEAQLLSDYFDCHIDYLFEKGGE